jgi:hypothetical protein
LTLKIGLQALPVDPNKPSDASRRELAGGGHVMGTLNGEPEVFRGFPDRQPSAFHRYFSLFKDFPNSSGLIPIRSSIASSSSLSIRTPTPGAFEYGIR